MAILLNSNFEHTVLKVNKDDQGNYLQLIMRVSNIEINLITIYAPNQDNPVFFNEIRNLAESNNTDYTIICGDFNLVLDPISDSYNYSNINNPKARKRVLEMINDLDLIDIYRYLHPSTKRFSWRKKTPLKQARLDYFLISKAMTDIIDRSNIKSSYRSDHSIIELNISLNTFTQGKGLWKFNNSLLKNEEYLKLINKIIGEEKEKYAILVYNLDYIKAEDTIEMTIDFDQFLEVLFLRIRGETIKFSSNLKRDFLRKNIVYLKI